MRLENSWGGAFYRELFCRIDETLFAKLYSEKASRPNTPINVLVGMEILKSGFRWSDEDLYNAFLFDLQVRYALGLRDLASGHFELRTLYNFRHRLSAHMRATGENPLEHVFAQVTDEQLAAYKLHTHEQRMDATFIASNIRYMSRLQLLVEVVHRVWRMLNAADQLRLGDLFAPYIAHKAERFCYRLTHDQVPDKLQAVGELLLRLKAELTTYATIRSTNCCCACSPSSSNWSRRRRRRRKAYTRNRLKRWGRPACNRPMTRKRPIGPPTRAIWWATKPMRPRPVRLRILSSNALRRQRTQTVQGPGRNRRAAVEALSAVSNILSVVNAVSSQCADRFAWRC